MAGPVLVAFTVPGIPAPQGSKTVMPNGHPLESNRERLLIWRNLVTAKAAEAMQGRPALIGPISLSVVFTLPRPRSHFGTGKRARMLKPSAPVYCEGRPDLDKLLRALGDSLKAGGAIADDARLVEIQASKHYGRARTDIELRMLV